MKAIVAHVYIEWIHPFGDGNGRTGCLIEFKILLSAGVPIVAAYLLSNHYNQTRTEYYRHLDESHKSGGNVIPFIRYAVQGFVDGLVSQIEMVQAQQIYVHWVNYIHDVFRDKNSTTQIRRRRLAIDLIGQKNDILLSKVRHITPRIAEAYANKTVKTLQRDVNALEELGLIVRTSTGIRPNNSFMSAFISPSC